MSENIIKMLNTHTKVVGLKQVLRALSEGKVRCVIIASDADSFIRTKVKVLATEKGAEILNYSSMKGLGQMCKIDVKASVVGIMKQDC